ncbi:MAG TPA: hypothetical protein VNC40_03870 [Gaiellaceae bacterium]|nr:hypothetical protein [Gaiellaceae bacterium]
MRIIGVALVLLVVYIAGRSALVTGKRETGVIEGLPAAAFMLRHAVHETSG